MKGSFCILCLLFCSLTSGQNLVKNPGFEEYYHLPDSIYEFSKRYLDSAFICKHWHKVRRTSPDYFHIRAKNIRYGIPYSKLGYYPAMGDSAYIGFVVLNLVGAIEPVSGEFTAPLIEGKKYEISFFYCFASDESCFLLDKIEAFISSDNRITQIDHIWPFYLEVIKKDITANVVFKDAVINDGKWHKMTGYYHAKGGEKYISFGFFYQNEKFYEIIDEYIGYGFIAGESQNKLNRFFRRYRKDLHIHRNPQYSPTMPNYASLITPEGETIAIRKREYAYYFIDNVSVVESD